MSPIGSVSLMTAVLLTTLMLNTCVEAAPAERDFLAKPPASRNSDARDAPRVAAADLEETEPSTDGASGRPRRRYPGAVRSAVAALARGGGSGTAATGLLRVPRSGQETTRPDKSTQMLKMMSALEELYRSVNGTLRRRIAFMPRANGRNSAKKSKAVPASEAVLKPTTAPSMETGGTVSRASTDHVLPSGRSFKKSIPPPKKSNKRVCFWKYCSQN